MPTTIYREIGKNKFKSLLILAFFIVFVMGIGFIFGEVEGKGGGHYGLLIAGIIAIIWGLIGYFSGDKITLAVTRAKKIEKKDLPGVYRLVENLAITAGLPTPQVYLINDPAPNAFATGRKPEKAVIALTSGLIQKLEKKELQGVIAHELSHIGNYDIRLMMLVLVLVGVVSVMSDLFLRFTYYSRGGGGNRRGNLQAILMLAALVLALLSPLIATLIQLMISRKREYLADATSALLTRYPEGLARALEKISKDHHGLRFATKGTAHLFITNPLRASFWNKLFSTHPPIGERIRILREMGV